MKKEQEVIKNNKNIKAKNDSSLETNDNNDVILNDQEEQEELVEIEDIKIKEKPKKESKKMNSLKDIMDFF